MREGGLSLLPVSVVTTVLAVCAVIVVFVFITFSIDFSPFRSAKSDICLRLAAIFFLIKIQFLTKDVFFLQIYVQNCLFHSKVNFESLREKEVRIQTFYLPVGQRKLGK